MRDGTGFELKKLLYSTFVTRSMRIQKASLTLEISSIMTVHNSRLLNSKLPYSPVLKFSDVPLPSCNRFIILMCYILVKNLYFELYK